MTLSLKRQSSNERNCKEERLQRGFRVLYMEGYTHQTLVALMEIERSQPLVFILSCRVLGPTDDASFRIWFYFIFEKTKCDFFFG